MNSESTPIVEHDPRSDSTPSRRPSFLARQVLDSATQFYRVILRARKVQGQARADTLREADTEFELLKALLRLGQERRYMSLGQYEHVSRMLASVGRQLGGWRISTEEGLAKQGEEQRHGI